jgi:hypothetical protein
MAIFIRTLGVIGVIFVAIVVWLLVRTINRRETWAKRTLAVVVGLPALYVASFGPVCWLTDRQMISYESTDSVFRPLAITSAYSGVYAIVYWYGTLMPLPSLPPEVADAVSDCRVSTAIQILEDAYADRYVREHRDLPGTGRF